MSSKKILLVDDSSTALMMEQMILRREQYQLVTARNGREAVEVALAERPDLIVMDVVMPEMTGFEACRAIRSDASMQGVPIILCTTRSEAKNMQEGYAAGCDDYITKPINSGELIAKVKTHLSKPR